ncbi:hypothetical protein V6N12_025073 [Hibiscus sabdariffa]|uniref:Expansin-like EG45 domain-containing protein n=1 Tax=Hibiscus sabdariffa TaxID=183260 RepID=A0ABR2BLD3_9ROSI
MQDKGLSATTGKTSKNLPPTLTKPAPCSVALKVKLCEVSTCYGSNPRNKEIKVENWSKHCPIIPSSFLQWRNSASFSSYPSCSFSAFLTGNLLHTRTATFYTVPYVPSACYGYEDDGVMIAAASDAIWDGGAVCGRQYKVKCKGATNESPHPCRGQDYVVVKIVDYCPSGCQGTIDLSQEAFAAIADPDAGKIKIYFHQV